MVHGRRGVRPVRTGPRRRGARPDVRTLIGVDGGGFAVSVGGGQPTSWLLETQGLDQATTVELAAAAVAVGS